MFCFRPLTGKLGFRTRAHVEERALDAQVSVPLRGNWVLEPQDLAEQLRALPEARVSVPLRGNWVLERNGSISFESQPIEVKVSVPLRGNWVLERRKAVGDPSNRGITKTFPSPYGEIGF